MLLIISCDRNKGGYIRGREMLTGLGRKPERILPFRRTRVKWKNNVKLMLKEYGLRLMIGFIWPSI
jgi:hypothetical protein